MMEQYLWRVEIIISMHCPAKDRYVGFSRHAIWINTALSKYAVDSTLTLYIASSYCFHAITYEGSLKWKYISSLSTSNFYSLVLGLNGSVIYVSTGDSSIYAFFTSTGSLKWKYRSDVPISTLQFTPAIGTDENIYFATYDSYIYSVSSLGSKQ